MDGCEFYNEAMGTHGNDEKRKSVCENLSEKIFHYLQLLSKLQLYYGSL
jgi:hypothetical protein